MTLPNKSVLDLSPQLPVPEPEYIDATLVIHNKKTHALCSVPTNGLTADVIVQTLRGVVDIEAYYTPIEGGNG